MQIARHTFRSHIWQSRAAAALLRSAFEQGVKLLASRREDESCLHFLKARNAFSFQHMDKAQNTNSHFLIGLPGVEMAILACPGIALCSALLIDQGGKIYGSPFASPCQNCQISVRKQCRNLKSQHLNGCGKMSSIFWLENIACDRPNDQAIRQLTQMQEQSLTDFLASAGWMLTEHATLCLHCPHLFLLTKKPLRPLKNRSQLEDTGILLPYGVAKRVGNSWPCTQSLAERQPGQGVPVPRTRVPDALLLARANRTGSRASFSPTSDGCLLFFPPLPPMPA